MKITVTKPGGGGTETFTTTTLKDGTYNLTLPYTTPGMYSVTVTVQADAYFAEESTQTTFTIS